MSEPTASERARSRAVELRETHRWLAQRHAEVERRASEVHEQAARVHELLGDRSLLDPAELRRHGQAEQDRSAREQAQADQD